MQEPSSPRFRPSSPWSWTFVGIAVVQALIVLAFESYIFAKFQLELGPDADNQVQTRAIPTFLTLYIFGFIYQLVLVWDALRLKNTIQVFGLVMMNVGFVIYGAVQMQQMHQAIDTLAQNVVDPQIWSDEKGFLIAIPCVSALGTVLLALVAMKLYDEFAWTIYKQISADLRMKRRYLTYQIYIALLKFDFFFFLGFTIQFVVIITTGRTAVEFGLTIAAIPVTIVILLLGALWVRRENLFGTIVVIFLYCCGLAYFIFKLYRMYSASHAKYYLGARKELTTFAVITIILIVLTIVNACVCAYNFGKGLAPYVSKSAARKAEAKEGYHNEMVVDPVGGNMVAAPPPRMTID